MIRDMKNIKITHQMLVQIAEIEEFKGAWPGLARQRAGQLKDLKEASVSEDSSYAGKVAGSASDLTDGYAELMNTIIDNYSAIPLSESQIRRLHGILLRTTAPPITSRSMGELIDWTRKNLESPLVHPLIIIGVFIVHFLAVYPLQDGNGQLSQALTAMLLLQKGYAYVGYCPAEPIIEAGQEEYYRALRRTQKGMSGEKADYEPWLSYFLSILQKQKRQLESKLGAMTDMENNVQVSRNQKALLDLFNGKPEWDSSEIAVELGMNKETVKKNLKSLTDFGYLIKHGTTKGAWYEIRY